jgi:hypothetical protein
LRYHGTEGQREQVHPWDGAAHLHRNNEHRPARGFLTWPKRVDTPILFGDLIAKKSSPPFRK